MKDQYRKNPRFNYQEKYKDCRLKNKLKAQKNN